MKKIFYSFLVILFSVLSSTNVLAQDTNINANELIIYSTDDYDIIGGDYIIKEVSLNSENEDNIDLTIHTFDIIDGKLNLNISGKSSELNASWFNEKTSGYNDDKINGDRNLYDSLATNLDFALSGDLNLTIHNKKNGYTKDITFPEVLIGLDSTSNCEKWWFGQKTGQHTKNPDENNSMLVIGYDTDGNLIYSSFSQIEDNPYAINLQDIATIQESRQLSYSLDDVISSISEMDRNGIEGSLSGFTGNYESVVNHIQGHCLYTSLEDIEYNILTHSVKTADYAHIFVGEVNTNKTLGFKTYKKDWIHPGGIQVIGDYLLVPNETNDSAYISLYDLRSLNVGELRKVENFELKVPHKAGSLAITSTINSQGEPVYILLIAHLDGENSVYHIYESSYNDGLENAIFEKTGEFSINKDFQGMGLVTENNTNKVYLIGLYSTTEYLSFADYVYLYEIDLINKSVSEELNKRHFKSDGGSLGILGVHFRYGSGVYVDYQGKLNICASERNTILGSDLVVNKWN